jgi:hypothetical protein
MLKPNPEPTKDDRSSWGRFDNFEDALADHKQVCAAYEADPAKWGNGGNPLHITLADGATFSSQPGQSLTAIHKAVEAENRSRRPARA